MALILLLCSNSRWSSNSVTFANAAFAAAPYTLPSPLRTRQPSLTIASSLPALYMKQGDKNDDESEVVSNARSDRCSPASMLLLTALRKSEWLLSRISTTTKQTLLGCSFCMIALLTLTSVHSGSPRFFTPPPAFALEQVESRQQRPQQQQSSSSSATTTNNVNNNEQQTSNNKYSPIDEIWTLIDKYYIDKSFHNQDWKAVRNKYKSLETQALLQQPQQTPQSQWNGNNNNNDSNDDDISMKLAKTMVKSLGDKYSRVLDVSQYAAIQKFDLIGVGVTLMPNDAKQIVVGAPPVRGSASDKAGLQVGDIVKAVNGVSTDGKSAFDIIDLIADEPNAKTVTMTILQQQQQEQRTDDNSSSSSSSNDKENVADATIASRQQQGMARSESSGSGDAMETKDRGGTRAPNNQETKDNGDRERGNSDQMREVTVVMDRTFQTIKDPIQYKLTETRKDGTKVGYVRISEFNSVVKAKLQDAFADLISQQGANALVLDLRNNPGGAFQSAVEISSLLCDDCVATYVVDSNGVELPFRTMPHRVVVPSNVPLAIWINGGSASASEVLAGSLHDNCRAVVMGQQSSFGKGLIQAVYGLKNGAGLVLTVAKYVTPNGTEIQGTGVQPDVTSGVPPYLPFVASDTSHVDFADISKRLEPSMCQVPTPH